MLAAMDLPIHEFLECRLVASAKSVEGGITSTEGMKKLQLGTQIITQYLFYPILPTLAPAFYCFEKTNMIAGPRCIVLGQARAACMIKSFQRCTIGMWKKCKCRLDQNKFH